jgi:isopentenyl-diphosphate delta-isomerase
MAGGIYHAICSGAYFRMTNITNRHHKGRVYDQTQLDLLKSEYCLLVDKNDQRIGIESKHNCHLVSNIRRGMLHRAFSVFLFNSEGKLLMQQRAAQKVTYPLFWTNTCCSHPLNLPDEISEENQIGVKRAAIRKLQHELGIPSKQLTVNDFKFLTRLHYKSEYDDEWGEHEIDYILFIQKDVSLNPSRNEVNDWRWFTRDELQQFVRSAQQNDIKLTPWFQLIFDHFLFKWWDSLDNLEPYVDGHTIHRFDN